MLTLKDKLLRTVASMIASTHFTYWISKGVVSHRVYRVLTIVETDISEYVPPSVETHSTDRYGNDRSKHRCDDHTIGD